MIDKGNQMGRSLKNIHKLIADAVQELPPEESFLNDLTSSIERRDADNHYVPSQTYKPSSMNCIRNMYFQRVGAEATDGEASMELIGMGESGTDRHERIQQAVFNMKNYGIDCEYIDVAEYVEEHELSHLSIIKQQGFETKLYHKDLYMSFLCDGIIKYKGEYYILEIKTETIYKWQGRKGVEPLHINQGTSYSTALEINKVLFLYECRDNCSKKAYILDVTNEMKEDLIVSRIEDCEQYVKNLTVPPKPKEASPKFCQYCNYRSLCKRS